jgi:uncharacterized hydrophobic protein (TIGR00271 family)
LLRFEGRYSRLYWYRFSMLLALAVIIATMGLLRNSGAVVIAAMLVAPLMTPIMGVAGALIFGRMGRAAMLLAIVALASGFCVLLAALLVSVADFPRGILIPSEVLARTDPGIEDLIVALAAGAAGAYVQVQKSEASLVPGAAIGVSLVPPLSAAGILLYFGETANAREAVTLFATNLGAIILSASVVYASVGLRFSVFGRRRRTMRFSAGIVLTLAFVMLLFGQLSSATFARYTERRDEGILAERILEWARPVSVEIVRIDVDTLRHLVELWVIVDLPPSAQYEVGSVADLLPERLRQQPLRDVVRQAIGAEFDVAVRYQTRIAALVDLESGTVSEAPSLADFLLAK